MAPLSGVNFVGEASATLWYLSTAALGNRSSTDLADGSGLVMSFQSLIEITCVVCSRYMFCNLYGAPAGSPGMGKV